jgi:hypothetical protein
MDNSIYEVYLKKGRNAFLLSLVETGHRNSWLKGQLTEELETVASPSSTDRVKAVGEKAIPPKAERAEQVPAHSANPTAKINVYSLPAHLQVLHKAAATKYKETAAIHNELAVDIYQQANLIPEAKRAEMITAVVEGRAWAITIFDRCRVYEQTGEDPGDGEKPALDETNPLQVFKKIQSLRSSISRFRKKEDKVKEAGCAAELTRLEEVYKTFGNV